MPIENLGRALAGMGAGFSGNTASWLEAQRRMEAQRQALDEQRQQAMAVDFRKVRHHLQSGDTGLAQTLLQNRLDAIGRLGGDPTESAYILRQIQEGDIPDAIDNLNFADQLAVSQKIIEPEISGWTDAFTDPQTGKRYGISRTNPSEGYKEIPMPAGVTGGNVSAQPFQKGGQELFADEDNNYFMGTLVFNPNTSKTDVAVIPVGHTNPQVGKLQPVNSQGIRPEDLAAAAEQKTRATERAKLETQFRLKPDVEARVREAVANVDLRMKEYGKDIDNTKILDAYEIAMDNLGKSLSGTQTGPWVGWLPAITENQQIAVGAISAMTPILKSIFRSAGEGTFTDQDQKLLMDMVPKRTDSVGARISKIKNIDAIVRAKLGSGLQRQPSQQAVEDPLGIR